ncbi:MAG: class I SAM-dependent methyltransferase [Candidatus Eiseniibacteriota bacterium]
MEPLLYRDLVLWYHLLDPVEDHREEAEFYGTVLERAATPSPVTLLELGCGAGNNASFLKKRFRCTLTDLSEDMLALSRVRNPECEHVLGDMRTLRLGRTFDVVFVHDAVTYMTNEEDLVAAIRTAHAHTRPGGAALFAPDCVRETFREKSGVISGNDGPLSLRCLEWHWDPDPDDGTYVVDFAFLLRENGTIRAVHDRHAQGLFAEDRWLALLGTAGFEAGLMRCPLDEKTEYPAVFVCRRPPGPTAPARTRWPTASSS